MFSLLLSVSLGEGSDIYNTAYVHTYGIKSFVRLLRQFALKLQRKIVRCTICCRYSILTAEEWSKLAQFYEVDFPITIKKTDNDYETNPGKYRIACITSGTKYFILLYERANMIRDKK